MNLDTYKDILLEFDSIAKKLNIPYFLLFGTCLEFTRNKGFIESTRDIDIGVKDGNRVPWRALIREMNAYGFTLTRIQPPRSELRRYLSNQYVTSMYTFEKNGVQLDIYVCYKDEINNRYITGRKYIIPSEYLENMVEMQWNGITLKMPNEKYLEYSYGDWKTPNPECSGPLH